MKPIEPALPESVPQMKALSFQASGHTQKSRSLVALANEYFSVEERSLKNWFQYVYDFSKHIGFIDSEALIMNDHWQSAMPNDAQIGELEKLLNGQEVDSDIMALAKRADIALLMAFFTMLSVPKASFDHFTQSHKQHFYKDVLQFRQRPEVADKAHIVISLIDDVASKTIEKGTLFKAGQDADGQNRVYQSASNAVINHSQVSQVYSLSQLSSTKQLLLTDAFNDSLRLDYPEAGVLTFGEAEKKDDERQSFPELGFTVASQELYLSGGVRTIQLQFKLKANSSLQIASILSCFNISISTSDGMLMLSNDNIEEHVTAEGIDLVIVLDEFFPVVSHFIDDAQPLRPKLANIEFVLKSDCLEIKPALSSASFSSLGLKVSVTGLGGVVANHDKGALDTSKPFEPFTFSPKMGSKFQFTHPELLIKNICNANLNFFWVDRPNSISDYYSPYESYRDSLDEGTYEWLKNSAKISYSDSLYVNKLDNIFSNSEPIENIDHHLFEFLSIDHTADNTASNHVYDLSALPVTSTTANQWPKWFTLTLSDNDFGHNDYARVSQYHGINNQGKNPSDMVIVNQPYTPLLEKVSIDYNSEVELNLDTLQQQPHHEVKHIHPLGRPGVEATHKQNIALLPKIDDVGYLYIGVANVTAPGQFRLYFQLEPVDGGNTTDAAILDWSYLDAGQWTTFSRSQGGRLQSRGRIIEDSTFNLLDSGVVTFEIPDMVLAENFLGNELFWLRISLDDQLPQNAEIAKYSRIKTIMAQGFEVVLSSGPHHASHYSQPLAAQTIDSQVIPDPKVSEVLQPYPSFSAKELETPQALEVRAAERIRHKNRALTSWDYEHLVLAQFPELYMARCYRNESTQGVEVVVVPVNYDPKVLQPKVPLFLKRKIQRFLSEISTNDLEVRVVDPIYEEVTFKVTLNIMADYDMDSAVAHLNQILIDYMTPWNKLATQNKGEQSKAVYLTQVGMALERHPAVDIIYTLQGRVNGNTYTQSIEPSSNAVILVSVADHEITLLNQITEVFEGIGKWKIEDDFIVT
ncbi:hypothetical protein ACU6U9_12520 [Pseudomonas sp. HK3]